MYVAGVLVTIALIECIQAPIDPSLVEISPGEMPLEVGAVHSIKPAIGWIMPVSSRVVTAAAATSFTAAYFSVAATSSLGVEFGDPAITLALNPSYRPRRELYLHLVVHVGY